MTNYGPPTPPTDFMEYKNYTTKNYLRGSAKKIIHDLNKVARLYNGRKLNVYDAGTGDRCPECTDLVTGAIVFSNCKVCSGTGKSQRNLIGTYWGFVDYGPWSKTPTDFGNTTNTGGSRDTFTIICSNRLKDQFLVVPVETKEVFKVINTEPLLVAMQGTIITQVVHCSKMAFGSPEYDVVGM